MLANPDKFQALILSKDTADANHKLRVYYKGDTHMTSTLMGVVCKVKMRCYQMQGVGVASVLDIQSLLYLLKKIGLEP